MTTSVFALTEPELSKYFPLSPPATPPRSESGSLRSSPSVQRVHTLSPNTTKMLGQINRLQQSASSPALRGQPRVVSERGFERLCSLAPV